MNTTTQTTTTNEPIKSLKEYQKELTKERQEEYRKRLNGITIEEAIQKINRQRLNTQLENKTIKKTIEKLNNHNYNYGWYWERQELLQILTEIMNLKQDKEYLTRVIKENITRQLANTLNDQAYQLYHEYYRQVYRKDGAITLLPIFNQEFHQKGLKLYATPDTTLITKPTEITIKTYYNHGTKYKIPTEKQLTIKGQIGIEIQPNYRINYWKILTNDNKPYPSFHVNNEGKICLGDLEYNNQKITDEITTGKWDKLVNTMTEIEHMLTTVDLNQSFRNYTIQIPENKEKYQELYDYIQERQEED